MKNTPGSLFGRAVQTALRVLDVMMVKLGLGHPSLRTSLYGAINDWLGGCRAVANSNTYGRRIGVYAFVNRLWVGTAAYCASSLYAMGHRPVLFYSRSELERTWFKGDRGSPMGDPHPRRILKRLEESSCFEVVNLDDYRCGEVEVSENDVARLRPIAKIKAAYELETIGPLSDDRLAETVGEIQRVACATKGLVRDYGLERAVVPNGTIYSSAGVFHGLRELDCEVVTLDSYGPREEDYFFWNLNQPTPEPAYKDWFDIMGDPSEKVIETVKSFIRYQNNPSESYDMWDKYRSDQDVSIGKSSMTPLEEFLNRRGKTALLGTNCVGDSAALGRQTIFDNQPAWLSRMVEWFEAHEEKNLLIRIHPNETLRERPVKLRHVARRLADSVENVFVIGPDESINTFELVDQVEVGLTWVSTLGVDLVARGVPVICSARAPYYDLGFVEAPGSKDEYWQLLEKSLSVGGEVNERQKRRAYKYLFVATRLRSLPGRPDPVTYPGRFASLGESLGGEFSLLYEIIAGVKGREEAYEWALGE